MPPVSDISTKTPGNSETNAEIRSPDNHLQFYNDPNAWVALFTGLLFLVTAFLAAYTWRLWKATSKLVEESEKSSQLGLRAYVGMAKKGLYETGGMPKMQIDNYGSTPASKVDIWRAIVDRAPSSFYYAPEGIFLAKNITIFPGQELPIFWADSMTEREGKFLYGFIEYTDIYGKRWRSRFAYQHMNGTWYAQHHEHNDEIEIQTPPPF